MAIGVRIRVAMAGPGQVSVNGPVFAPFAVMLAGSAIVMMKRPA